MSRISQTFKSLKENNKKAFASFVVAGDPNYKTSLNIINELAKNVDIIELGIPFLDPAGDGPTIEAASKRAIQGGMKLRKVLELVVEFRQNNLKTPIVLMGYYNPVLHYGIESFCIDAKNAGVDGLLIVDLPPEEDEELRLAATKSGLDFIKLVALTSSENRIKTIVPNASGFLYLVSILGITGTKAADLSAVEEHLQKIKKASDLPVVIGFGIKQKQQVQEIYKIHADGFVVGSALVKVIEDGTANGLTSDEIVQMVGDKARTINDL